MKVVIVAFWISLLAFSEASDTLYFVFMPICEWFLRFS